MISAQRLASAWRYWGWRGYVLFTVVLLAVFTAFGGYVINRYEAQRIDALIRSERAKLTAVHEMARLRQMEALRTQNRLQARLSTLLGQPRQDSREVSPAARRVAILNAFSAAFDSTPDYMTIELFADDGAFLTGMRKIGFEGRLPTTLELTAPVNQHILNRDKPSPGAVKVFPAELDRENGRLLDEPVPVMFAVSWIVHTSGEPRFLLVMKYGLEGIYSWSERVMSDHPRVDHFRVASDGMVLIGGERFADIEFAADRGVKGKSLSDVLPTLWQAISGSLQGSVDTEDGLYLFQNHASAPELNSARESAYATSILFLPHQTLYATSIFAGAKGFVVIAVGYGLLFFIIWGYWRQPSARRVLERQDPQVSQAFERLEHATRFGRLGFIEINIDTGEVYANDTFFRMHDKPVPASATISLAEISAMFANYQSVLDRHEAMVVRALRGESVETIDYDYRDASGADKRFRLAVALSQNDQGQRLCRSLYSDVTDLYEQQRALVRAQEKQASMFKIIAHELRTPAAATRMIASELADGVAVKHELLSTSEHLLSVIDDLRVAVNPSAEIDSKLVTFSLDELLSEAERQVRALFASVGLVLEMPFVEPGGTLYVGDAYRLRTVLTNLLRNAAYHSGAKRVWISVDFRELDETQDEMVLLVDDDGSGIPSEMVERLFEPFERGDTRAGGTGVGLYIARAWMELMGGQLDYCPSQFGGACFEVILPVQRAAIDQPPTDTDDAEAKSVATWLSGKSVLLVEDDMLLQKATERLLRQFADLRVSVATDGRKALRLHRQQAADLILSDYLMPNMDGLEMIRELRADNDATPVIALTAATLGDEQEALKAAGADAVLAKPLSIAKLNRALAKILSRHDASVSG